MTALLAVGQGIGVLTDPQAGPAPVAAVLGGGLIVGLPLGLVSFVVWTAAVLLFTRLLGGDGSFRTTACGLGFAYVPLVFAVIVSALSLPFGTGAVMVVYPAFLAAGLWSSALDVVAVREIHDLTTGRAVAAVLLPIVLFLLGLILLFGALVAALVTTA